MDEQVGEKVVDGEKFDVFGGYVVQCFVVAEEGERVDEDAAFFELGDGGLEVFLIRGAGGMEVVELEAKFGCACE